MIRPATVEDQRRAFTNTDRIPFHQIDDQALATMQIFLAELGWDVDKMLLGRALAYYFEVSEA